MTNLPENPANDASSTTDSADAVLGISGRLPRRLYVRLAVVAAFLLTLITTSTLAWRWYQDRFPNAIILATGDQTAAGVEVVVRADDGHEIARGTLNEQNNYQFPVLVEQGFHTVGPGVGPKSLSDQRLFIKKKNIAEWKSRAPPDLRGPPATQPSGTALR